MVKPSRGIGAITLVIAVCILFFVEQRHHSIRMPVFYRDTAKKKETGNPQFCSAGISGNNILRTIFSFVIKRTDADTNDQSKSLPQTNNIHEKYVLVKTGPTRVLEKLTPDSPILGMANRGKLYPLIKAGDSWCTIKFKEREGWIERQFIDIVNAPTSSNMVVGDLLVTTSIIGAIGIVLFLIYFFVGRLNRMKAEWFSPIKTSKKIIIVSRTETQVQRQLTDTITSLEKCFTEIGFDVRNAHDGNATMKLIYHFIPDALVVDWQIGTNAQEVIEQILASKSFTNNIFVLFYNVPDPASVIRSAILPNTYYLGISFTDRDLFNVITPLIITGEKQQSIRKSIETTALKGDIRESNLSDVFQFIEIGRKTGCLLIETEKPIGIVYFNDGIIIYASTQHSAGKKAVFEILDFQEGQFYFVLDRQPKSSNCTIPIVGILMEWTQETDETSGNRLRQT